MEFSSSNIRRLYDHALSRKAELQRELQKVGDFIAALELVDGIKDAPVTEEEIKPAFALVPPEAKPNGKPRKKRKEKKIKRTPKGEMAAHLLTIVKEMGRRVPGHWVSGPAIHDFAIKNRPKSLKNKVVSKDSLRHRSWNMLGHLAKRGKLQKKKDPETGYNMWRIAE